MKKGFKRFLIIAGVLVAVGVITFAAAELFVISASGGDISPGADYLIVLGAKVNPGGPSRALHDRLSAAFAYLRDNPDTVAVVSGGMGPDEPETEAACMKRWLMEKGIAEARIIEEDESTRTVENLLLSCAAIGEGWRDKRVAVASSDYHLCRIKMLGRKFLDYDFETLSAPTSLPAYKLMYFCREALGLVYTVIFHR